MHPGRYLKFQYYKMIRVKDTPSKVAQGVGLGVALDFAIPIPFLSIFIAFIVARIFKMNSLAAVMSASALKPLFPAMVYLNLTVRTVIEALFPVLSMDLPLAEGTTYPYILLNTILEKGLSYIVAGFFNGAVIFLLSYLVIYYSIKARIRKVKLKKQNSSKR